MGCFLRNGCWKFPGRSTGSSYEHGVDNWIVSIFSGGVCGYCYCEQHHETKNWLALQPAHSASLSAIQLWYGSKSWDSGEHQKQQLVNGHSSSHNSKVVVGLDQSPKLFSLASADGLPRLHNWGSEHSIALDLLPGNIQVLWKMLWTPWFWYGFVKNSWINRGFTVWLSQSGNLGVSCFQRTTMKPYVHWNAGMGGMGQYL